MLHIFLTILKIPFILLAVLLLLLLTVTLLLLFVPVRYQASAEKAEVLTATARITWLLHLLSVRIRYLDGKLRVSVKICGCTVIGEKKKKRRRMGQAAKKAAPEIPPQKTLPSEPGQPETSALPEPEASVQPEDEPEASVPPEDGPEPEAFVPPEDGPEPETSAQPEDGPEPGQPRAGIFERLKIFFENLANSFRLLLEKIRNIRQNIEKLKRKLDYYKKLWYDVHTQEALRHVKKEIRYLIRHYFPGKIEGDILFGLDDPAATGQLLGIMSILQVAAGNHVIVDADFTKPVLEGRLFMKGHIRACHAVKMALALLLDKNIRITIKRIRKLTGR